MASQPRPTDELLIEAARAHVLRLCGPGRVPRAVVIHVEGVPDPIKIPVLPGSCQAGPTAAARPPFTPSAYQERIMDALGGRAMTADQLAEKVGDRRRLFRAGGLKELKEHGLVALHPRLGYYLPDDPPEEISQELS